MRVLTFEASLLLLLLLVELAPASRSSSPDSDRPERIDRELGCDQQLEFTCESEKRCIPLEWRCDFTEQCLDGQDELGCLPESCHFERDLCNFRNAFASETAPAATKNAWRRYQSTSSEAGKQWASVWSGLHELAAGSSSFLFVPLSPKLHAKTLSAALVSPQLGQTNSMCQLVFKYALWTGESAAGNAHDTQTNLTLLLRQTTTAAERIVWSKSVEGASRPRWLLGVADLGHLRHGELRFEAAASISPAAGTNQAAGEQSRRSLVAIDWLRFQGCAWPQGARNGYLMELDLHRTAEPSSAPACKLDEFQCSNGICLPARKLCNFVDDCMSSAGQPELAAVGEDEGPDLCDNLPGRESFERAALEYRWPPSSGRFWSLDSNLPHDKILVRSSPLALAHLPRVDHTLRTARGQYLSFEIPHPQPPSSTKAGQLVHWIELKSAWLRKAADEEECRVKFFYNLVLDQPYHADQGIAAATLPFRIYISVEHFVLERDLFDPTRVLGTVKKLDKFVHSQLVDDERLLVAERAGSIDYSGLDIWREANYKLLDLHQGDTFYLKLSFIVESSRMWTNETERPQRATLNIDDLSTHFGCELAPSSTQLRQVAALFDHSRLNNSINIDQYIAKISKQNSISSLPPRRRFQRTVEQPVVEMESRELVGYVLAVLVSIIGVILAVVFVLVPYVEQLTMSYHDQLTVSLSEMSYDERHNNSASCELRVGSTDWDRVSGLWQRSAAYSDWSERQVNSLSLTLPSQSGNCNQNNDNQMQESSTTVVASLSTPRDKLH